MTIVLKVCVQKIQNKLAGFAHIIKNYEMWFKKMICSNFCFIVFICFSYPKVNSLANSYYYTVVVTIRCLHCFIYMNCIEVAVIYNQPNFLKTIFYCTIWILNFHESGTRILITELDRFWFNLNASLGTGKYLLRRA